MAPHVLSFPPMQQLPRQPVRAARGASLEAPISLLSARNKQGAWHATFAAPQHSASARASRGSPSNRLKTSNFESSQNPNWASATASEVPSRPTPRQPVLARASPNRTQSPKAVDSKGELPYRLVRGRKYFLDELDVVSFLDAESSLRPFNPDSYNPVLYLWKKIADIDPHRRHRILDLMEPRHVSALWRLVQDNPWQPNSREPSFSTDADGGPTIEIDAVGSDRSPPPQLKSANEMLPRGNTRSQALQPELWDGKVCGLPWPVEGMSKFQKAFFLGRDGRRYGRVILGDPVTRWLGDRLTPLYFEVLEASQVLASEEYAQASFEYADGQLQLNEPGCLPEGFPRAAPHPPRFNDDMRDYVAAVGPGVLVGQTWQEGVALDAIPKQFLGEFVLVKRYPESA